VIDETQLTRSRGWFDPTINLGHVLTFIGFIIAGFVAWSTLDKRLTVMEETRSYQRQTDSNQDQRALDGFLQMRETLARLDRQVERIADRLDKTGAK
jgi:hypothetical protein